MTLGCNEGPEIDLEGGADNRLFKLTKAPRPFATPCKPKPRSDQTTQVFLYALAATLYLPLAGRSARASTQVAKR